MSKKKSKDASGKKSDLSPIVDVVPFEKNTGIVLPRYRMQLRKMLRNYVLHGTNPSDWKRDDSIERLVDRLLFVPDMSKGPEGVEYRYGYHPELLDTPYSGISGLVAVFLKVPGNEKLALVEFPNDNNSKRQKEVATMSGAGNTIKYAGMDVLFNPDKDGHFAIDIKDLFHRDYHDALDDSLGSLSRQVPSNGMNVEISVPMGAEYVASVSLSPTYGIRLVDSLEGSVVRGEVREEQEKGAGDDNGYMHPWIQIVFNNAAHLGDGANGYSPALSSMLETLRDTALSAVRR